MAEELKIVADPKKYDFTSTAVEKAIDLAREFLGKLIFLAVEEVGLLIKSQASLWLLQNQVNVLIKAKDYCIKKGISPKVISLKLLCPLLNAAALEEDEYLQDKWAVLLGNLVDSEQNIQNYVLPALLSQVSKNEFDVLDSAWKNKLRKMNFLKESFSEQRKSYLTEPRLIERALNPTLDELDKNHQIFLTASRNQDERIQESVTRLELANLMRLNLIKEEVSNQVMPLVLDFPILQGESRFQIEPKLLHQTNLFLTVLGEELILACSERLSE